VSPVYLSFGGFFVLSARMLLWLPSGTRVCCRVLLLRVLFSVWLLVGGVWVTSGVIVR
jgi:hypothetical protein